MKLIDNQKNFEYANMGSTCQKPIGKFIPSAKTVKKSKYLTAYVDEHYWSYVVTSEGFSSRVTLEGYGSCTPEHIMQRYIDEMPIKEQKKWFDRINKKGIKEVKL
jgi:hypothetical protein